MDTSKVPTEIPADKYFLGYDCDDKPVYHDLPEGKIVLRYESRGFWGGWSVIFSDAPKDAPKDEETAKVRERKYAYRRRSDNAAPLYYETPEGYRYEGMLCGAVPLYVSKADGEEEHKGPFPLVNEDGSTFTGDSFFSF